MDFAQILVYILAAALALFLILAIVLMIMVIRVTQQIKSITTTAQHAVDNVDKLVTNAGRLSSPLALAKLLSGHANKLRRKSSHGEKK